MAKFHGSIGYAIPAETKRGIWDNNAIEEHVSYGDFLDNRVKAQTPNQVNDELSLSTKISILADPFATLNSGNMKYVKFDGTAWKITSIEPRYPRLILTLGGVYSGKKA